MNGVNVYIKLMLSRNLFLLNNFFNFNFYFCFFVFIYLFIIIFWLAFEDLSFKVSYLTKYNIIFVPLINMWLNMIEELNK